jgi:hypothetical protein
MQKKVDRLCGLVVIVPGYRSRGPRFGSRRYQIIWEVVGLERGPPSFVNTIEELLGRKSSAPVLENREYVYRDPLSWPRNILWPQMLALTSPTSCGRSAGIIPPRTKPRSLYTYPTYITYLVLAFNYSFWIIWFVSTKIFTKVTESMISLLKERKCLKTFR